jgi:DNA-binding IclR family transcriptional regulator
MNEINTSSVRVLRRAFDILEAFDEEHAVMSLQEISNRIDLPKTTAFRLISTMVETGYLVQTRSNDYCLSYKFMALAAVAQSTFDIRNTARPAMERIREQTNESVDISIQTGQFRICIEVLESHHKIKSIIRPGETVPLHLGAVGKTFLAFGPAELLDRLIAMPPEPDFDTEELRRQVSAVREQGYAFTTGERVPGASAIAAPVRDHTGRALYALAVTGPAYRFDERQAEFREILLEGAREISSLLGWILPKGGKKPPASTINDNIGD